MKRYYKKRLSRRKPRQHKRKAFYRKGRFVSETTVNKGFGSAVGKNIGPVFYGVGKAGFSFLKKKGEEAGQRAAEKREAERKEAERKRELGITEAKKPISKRLVEKVPGVKFLEERGEKKAYQEAQKRAGEVRLEQGQKVYEIQKIKLEAKPKAINQTTQ